MPIYTIADGNIIFTIDYTPIINISHRDSGFIYWRGLRREIRDIHVTKNGTQYELFPANYWAIKQSIKWNLRGFIN